MLRLVVLIMLFPPMDSKVHTVMNSKLHPIPIPHEQYQHGDILLGGISSLVTYPLFILNFKKHPSTKLFEVPEMLLKFYQHILALVFAINEINENPYILPNVTLGSHIYDSYYDVRMTYRSTLDLLFKSQRFVPSYKCNAQENLIAVIGGLGSETSYRMADILSLYKIPQLTYGSFAPEDMDGRKFLSFYRMVSNEEHQYMGIVQLLIYFRWTWIGLLVVKDESGENFVEAMESLLSQNEICVAFIERVEKQYFGNTMGELYHFIYNIYKSFSDSKSNTLVFYGESMALVTFMSYIFLGNPRYKDITEFRRVWIMTAQTEFVLSGHQKGFDFQFLHGAISFTVHTKEVLRFQKFLQHMTPDWKQGGSFLQNFWEQTFECTIPNPHDLLKDDSTCTGEEKLENLPEPFFEMHMSGHSYSIYNAVYAVALAFHALQSSRLTHRVIVGGKRFEIQDVQPWQLHPFLQCVSFNNSAGETVFFNDKMEMKAGFDIKNMVTFANKSFLNVKVGSLNPNADKWKKITIDEDMIVWQTSFNQGLPLSLCNDFCAPGSQKQKKEREKFCCYDCIPCPEGKISDQKDMDECKTCPEDCYPTKNRDGCVFKVITFLSFDEPLGICLTSVATSFSLITISMLGIFIKHRNTPLVKANNRDITYILLLSLLLCFLSSLLFLGQPQKETCFLRQPTFGIIFSLAVSCVLAKTVTVVVAFMANKPGSNLRKWVGKRLTYSIIILCSFVQAAICTLWLGVSPPFPDFDTKSLMRETVAECNEGSALMFSVVLAYMGLLSLISLIVAFLARKLPDSFNESKFINFSMLIFCSVWVSFVPTYLSSKGKYMVAVEIFSILASAAGLLLCIFFPKCYIIVLRPGLNTKGEIIKRNK